MARNNVPPLPTSPAPNTFVPSAPPIDDFDLPPGYEQAVFGTSVPLPPPPEPTLSLYQFQEQQIADMPPFYESDVIIALDEYVEDNCCFGSGPVARMTIRNITMKPAFNYNIETFTENRETCMAFEPYKGGNIDGPENGPVPAPWDVRIPEPNYFVDGKQKFRVPHTESVRNCHTCAGAGRVKCTSCDGTGRRRCFSCYGSGRDGDSACTSCSGRGYSSCWICTGGMKRCSNCDGHGKLKCYLQLKVYWKNNKDDYIVEDTDLPDHLIKEVTGKKVFKEEYQRIQAVQQFPDDRIVTASRRLVQRHNDFTRQGRILKMRHSIQVVPVAVVDYEYRNKDGQFFVYGLERKVWFQDYPSQCCFCTIF